MNIKIGDVLTIESGYVKVVEIINNRYLVADVNMGIFNYTVTNNKYCIEKRNVLNNLGTI